MKGELFHVEKQTDRRMDRQTDITKLIVPLSNFANPNNNPVKGRIYT